MQVSTQDASRFVDLGAMDRQVAALSGFGAVAGFGRRPAVVVVDMTQNFCGDRPEPILDSIQRWPHSCGEAAWDAAKVIDRVLGVARTGGVPVFFSVGFDQPPDARASGRWKDKNSRTLDGVQGTAEYSNALCPPLEVAPGEVVLPKEKPSAFFGTPILSYLIDQSIDTLIFTGAVTSGCVRSSVVDAFSYGYRCVVVEEGVVDRYEISHRAALFDMSQKYADVVTADEVCTYLERTARG